MQLFGVGVCDLKDMAFFKSSSEAGPLMSSSCQVGMSTGDCWEELREGRGYSVTRGESQKDGGKLAQFSVREIKHYKEGIQIKGSSDRFKTSRGKDCFAISNH